MEDINNIKGDMKMEELDILTLDNGKDYVITKVLEYNDRCFLLLIEVNKDENLLDDKLIVEKVNDGKTEFLQIIDDERLNIIVSEKFAKMLLEDLK